MAEIVFTATVEKVQTQTDGAIRVWLDLPETAVAVMAQLAECKRVGLVLDITAKEVERAETKVKGYGL